MLQQKRNVARPISDCQDFNPDRRLAVNQEIFLHGTEKNIEKEHRAGQDHAASDLLRDEQRGNQRNSAVFRSSNRQLPGCPALCNPKSVRDRREPRLSNCNGSCDVFARCSDFCANAVADGIGADVPVAIEQIAHGEVDHDCGTGYDESSLHHEPWQSSQNPRQRQSGCVTRTVLW